MPHNLIGLKVEHLDLTESRDIRDSCQLVLFEDELDD